MSLLRQLLLSRPSGMGPSADAFRKSHEIKGSTAGEQTDYQVKIIASYEAVKYPRILTFNKIPDAGDIFYLEPQEVANIRFGGGGLKLKSGGAWVNLLWHVKTADLVRSGLQIFYKTGLVYYYGTNVNQALVQVDREPFILIRCVLGNLTVPLVDGYSYQTDGSVVAPNVTLANGEYVVFYKVSAPSLGTYYSSSIESGTGFRLHLFKTDDATDMPFYFNFGSGQGRVTTDIQAVYNRVEYDKSSVLYSTDYLPPAIPITHSNWHMRVARQVLGVLATEAYTLGARPSYLDDPNTATWQNTGNIIEANYIPSYDTNWWGWSFKVQHYDTSFQKRYQHKVVALYFKDGAIWKTRNYQRIILQSVVFNYDQGGNTIGYGCVEPTGLTYEEAGYTYSESYKHYVAAWTDETFVGLMWENGAKATRTLLDYGGTDVYIYTKYLTKPQDAITYRYATDADASYWTAHYFTLWVDVNHPANTRMGVEHWFAETDQYEAVPPDPTTEEDSFYDQFFTLDFDVSLEEHCRTDFGDVRFRQGETELDYWIEEKVDGEYAIFWVEVDSIPADPDSATIYVYYGKAEETTASNGPDTFVFIDEFTGADGDPPSVANWDLIESAAPKAGSLRDIQSNELHIKHASAVAANWRFYGLRSDNTYSFANGRAFNLKMQVDIFDTDYYSGLNICPTSATYAEGEADWIRFTVSHSATRAVFRITKKIGGVETELVGYTNIYPVSHNVEIRIDDTNVKIFIGDYQEYIGAHGLGFTVPYIYIETWTRKTVLKDYYFDNCWVRKYVDPEPAHGDWGPEEYAEWPF